MRRERAGSVLVSESGERRPFISFEKKEERSSMKSRQVEGKFKSTWKSIGSEELIWKNKENNVCKIEAVYLTIVNGCD
jgi:hypothetical protein